MCADPFLRQHLCVRPARRRAEDSPGRGPKSYWRAGPHRRSQRLSYLGPSQFRPVAQWHRHAARRRFSRFRIGHQNELTGKETVATFGEGDFPDGLALEAEGGAWVVCVGSNRVYRIAPDGKKLTVIDDAEAATAKQLEAAFVVGTLDRPQLSAARGAGCATSPVWRLAALICARSTWAAWSVIHWPHSTCRSRGCSLCTGIGREQQHDSAGERFARVADQPARGWNLWFSVRRPWVDFQRDAGDQLGFVAIMDSGRKELRW